MINNLATAFANEINACDQMLDVNQMIKKSGEPPLAPALKKSVSPSGHDERHLAYSKSLLIDDHGEKN